MPSTSGALPRVLPFKIPRNQYGEMKDIHDYAKRLASAKRRIAQLENAELLLNFVAHLEALGLSMGRVAKYANHACALTKRCPSKQPRQRGLMSKKWSHG